MSSMTPLALLLLLALSEAPKGRVEGLPQDPLRDPAAAALKKAVEHYRTRVARHGGYVYYTSLDLAERWGEGKATPDQVWVQPPGTPTVGMAFLAAYAATGGRECLDAAREAGAALVHGQLQSGGWTNLVDFGGGGRRAGRYRNGKGGSWNTSSLDDGQTQSALLFLVRLDAALESRDAAVRDAAEYGLSALLKAQFPNGGFPQVWQGPVEARPVLPAAYPDRDWRSEGRVKNYWDHYTLNDGLAGGVSALLAESQRLTKRDDLLRALEKLGDFLLLARMPEPQPAWCQQYDAAMLPIWARKFEPPAVSGWESQDAIETLLAIHAHTGKRKYLEPLPRSLEYLKSSLLPDGRLARFYELRTNKPLYMTRAYELTHDDSDLPDHYGWKMPSRLADLEARLAAARSGARPAPPGRPSDAEVRRVIADLDAEGRWVSAYSGERLVGQPKFAPGFRFLSSAVFSSNVELLSRFLAVR